MDLSSRINYRFFFLLARGENKRGKGGGGGGEGVRGMEIGHHRSPYVFLTGMIEAVSQRCGNNTGCRWGEEGRGYLPVETKHRRLSRSSRQYAR